MRREKVYFKSLGNDLCGIIDSPDNHKDDVSLPGIILLHGLTNAKEDCPLIKETDEALVNENFITFRFDFFGSGESAGMLKDKTWSILEQNSLDAIDFFSKKTKINKIGLFGRSSGGPIAILSSVRPNIKCFVLVSSYVLLAENVSKFKQVMELERSLEKEGKMLPGTGKYKGEYGFNETFFKESITYETKLLEILPRMSNVMVLGTTPDTKVSLKNSTTIINKVKEPKEIHIFEGVDHDYKGVEDQAVDFTVSWFKKYLKHEEQ